MSWRLLSRRPDMRCTTGYIRPRPPGSGDVGAPIRGEFRPVRGQPRGSLRLGQRRNPNSGACCSRRRSGGGAERSGAERTPSVRFGRVYPYLHRIGVTEAQLGRDRPSPPAALCRGRGGRRRSRPSRAQGLASGSSRRATIYKRTRREGAISLSVGAPICCMVSLSSARSISRTRSTPSWPNADSPQI